MSARSVLESMLLGDSIAMCRLRSLIERVAPSNLPVLIEGATGSGKELVAQAIHIVSGRKGVFVPFMGRLSSTPVGPAAIALRHGSPIVMGFITRRQDGRHEIDILPALDLAAAVGPDAVRIVTAQHTACLETWVRRHPEMWLWLHRRFKHAVPA